MRLHRRRILWTALWAPRCGALEASALILLIAAYSIPAHNRLAQIFLALQIFVDDVPPDYDSCGALKYLDIADHDNLTGVQFRIGFHLITPFLRKQRPR